jgi:hypothetical protein
MLWPYESFGGIQTLRRVVSDDTLARGPQSVYLPEILQTTVD